MDPCVYTTQHETWLRAASGCTASQLVCFRSARRWATAGKLLTTQSTLPVLFRQQDEATPVLACRFIADLVEIHFADDFESDEKRLAWLDERLWLQRETIKNQSRTERFPTWESQFKTWEIDNFLKAKTWYIVRGLREIDRLPLPRLRKLKGDHPLSPNFVRGYALCRYPQEEIRRIPKVEPAA